MPTSILGSPEPLQSQLPFQQEESKTLPGHLQHRIIKILFLNHSSTLRSICLHQLNSSQQENEWLQHNLPVKMIHLLDRTDLERSSKIQEVNELINRYIPSISSLIKTIHDSDFTPYRSLKFQDSQIDLNEEEFNRLTRHSDYIKDLLEEIHQDERLIDLSMLNLELDANEFSHFLAGFTHTTSTSLWKMFDLAKALLCPKLEKVFAQALKREIKQTDDLSLLKDFLEADECLLGHFADELKEVCYQVISQRLVKSITIKNLSYELKLLTAANLTHLTKVLHLQNSYLDDDQLKTLLKAFPNLTILDLTSTPITGFGLKSSSHARLQKLSLHQCIKLSEKYLSKSFSKMKALTELNLSKTNLNGSCLKNKNFTLTLQHLDLSHCIQLDENLLSKAFAQYKSLTHILLDHTKITGTCLAQTGFRESIRKVHLQSCKCLDENQLAHSFQTFTMLSELDLSDTFTTGICLLDAGFKQTLQRLDLMRCKHLDEGFLTQSFTQFTNLTSIKLAHTAVTTSCLKTSGFNHSLLELTLDYCLQLDEESLSLSLNRLSQLNKLNMNHTGIDGACLINAGFKKDLKELSLQKCQQLNEKSLFQAFSDMTELIELDLQSTDITTSCLLEAGFCHTLRSLNLSFCPSLSEHLFKQAYLRMNSQKLTLTKLAPLALNLGLVVKRKERLFSSYNQSIKVD